MTITHTLNLVTGALLLMVVVFMSVLLTGTQAEGQEGVVRTNTTGSEYSEDQPQSIRLDKEIVDEIQLIASITIDDTFFSDPTFLALRDFSKPLPNHPVGRRDPFRPSGLESVTAVVTPAP